MRERLILSPSLPGRFDGIGDYAWHLSRALAAHGPVRLVARGHASGAAGHDGIDIVPSWRALGDAAWRDRAHECAGALLQYLPQAFLRGDLRGCVRWLDQVRAAHRPIVLTIHEYWPPADGRLRRAGVRFVCRRVLAMLLARSTHVVLTQGQASQDLEAAGLLRNRAVRIIPVGSNIERQRDRPPDTGPRLVLFGQPASMHEPTMVALGAWLNRRTPALPLVWINRSDDEMRDYWRTRVRQPDRLVDFQSALSPEAVSAQLLSATIGVAPYVNGSSTRRTTLMALLQHGLPVAGLDGVATSELLRASGALRLSPEGEPDAFLRALDALVADHVGRAIMSQAAERLYLERLSWPRIAESYLAAMSVAAELTRA